ncbi:MAG: hypothetical protein CVT74_05040 [Alphaproteobacteria bacterium HGW-Alphaproteobacteria-13]|nr:MAG: hypothetical protein CVT74_05040 [Alphaproteobacteria bacterium HGW-Alphaproteobacteria-13]
MSGLSDLIDTIETACEPSRDIDVAIALAQPETFFNAGPRWDGDRDCIGQINTDGSRSMPGNSWDMLVPAYTFSLDAAVELVPEGRGWIAGWGQTRADEPMGGARITRNARFVGHDANYDMIAEAEAATPALALCAAALKARDATQ